MCWNINLHLTLPPAFFYLFASTHQSSYVSVKWSIMHKVRLWRTPFLQQASCDCLRLLLKKVQLDKDTWITAWQSSLWLCQLQFLFSTNHEALYHLDTSVSLSLSFRVSVAACCWRCLWGCPVPTGSLPPCCPLPRESYGPGSEGPAAEPSSRSRSSTLGPSLRRHAQTARSCPQPAMEEPVRHVGLGVGMIQH